MRKPEEVDRPRLGALSVLPVFFKLDNKKVLLAGNDSAAAWKAELVAASGALVRVAGKNLCDEFRALKKRTPDQYEFLGRDWKSEDFTGASLAIGSFDDDLKAREFADTAHQYGVPVNLIDTPALCDFQFGAIVNRSPVVVSISTDGAAPALGQAIRRRIETLLPAAIADWATAAQSLRKNISAKIPAYENRVSFWRAFAHAAFISPSSKINATIKSLLAREPNRCGKVTLVGAGPGDAEYLTLKAVRALQSADIILFDDLVSDDVLDLARREAKRLLVGKRGGRASCKQDDINQMMLHLAQQGKHVVRLKSGDPMIFGRAGEEIEMLESAGIEVEIAPGVTTALAVAAQCKTSLTHRDCAQGVTFITGHSRKGELPDIDWHKAADPDVTLMVYMGARKAAALARRLIAEGLDENTPVVTAIGVSRPEQELRYGSLGELTDQNIDTEEPVMLGIGRVFAACEKRLMVNSEDSDLKTIDHKIAVMA